MLRFRRDPVKMPTPSPRLALKTTRLGLRNSTTRMPFRYGRACLTRCPQAVLGATIELDGRRQEGYSGDCLPPGWFDKAPDKSFKVQIDDMLAAIAMAERIFAGAFSQPTPFFPAWRQAADELHSSAAKRGLTALLASFGVGLVERAILDAIARATGLSFARLVRGDALGIVPEAIHPELSGLRVRDWLPHEPSRRVWVRHTVGLADPLTVAEIPSSERLNDGLPQALEEYIERTGLRYFKVKVSNQLDRDHERLRIIASLVERRRGDDYRVTLDGNEQYRAAGEFDEFVEAVLGAPELATLWRNTLLVEQPLARDVALDPRQTGGIRRLASQKPVVIDESDGTLESYLQALALGYRGVSSKNCKGAMRSLLNAGLTWIANDRGTRREFLMTGEDLCTVGIVPVQSDLCLAATLGLDHVERNGHHFHRGLSYLPQTQRRAALAAHGDFYGEQDGLIAPRITDGRFEIASLQCVGYGFAVEPDFSSYQPADSWSYASLGL